MKIAAALSILGVALSLSPAWAQGMPADLDARLAEMARPFLVEENRNANALEIDATVECVMAVLRPLPDDLKSVMLGADDFEDALDAAVMVRPELERPLEACF